MNLGTPKQELHKWSAFYGSDFLMRHVEEKEWVSCAEDEYHEWVIDNPAITRYDIALAMETMKKIKIQAGAYCYRIMLKHQRFKRPDLLDACLPAINNEFQHITFVAEIRIGENRIEFRRWILAGKYACVDGLDVFIDEK